MSEASDALARARDKILGRLAPLLAERVGVPAYNVKRRIEDAALSVGNTLSSAKKTLTDLPENLDRGIGVGIDVLAGNPVSVGAPTATPSPQQRAPVAAEQVAGTEPTAPTPAPEPGSHLGEGEYPVWFERGAPEKQFAGQPAVNPYTGAPLKETPIFGGLGTVSEAFATPSDASIRFQNPYADSNLSPMQQKMAASEIKAIQESLTKNKSQAVWDIVRANGRKVKEINADPSLPQSVKDQINQQYAQEIEEAGKYTDPEHLLESYQAQQDPAVTLAKQKESWEHVFAQRWKNPDMAHMIAGMGTLDPKTGQPNWELALKMASSFDQDYRDSQREMRENRKTKEGALANLRAMAEEAAVKGDPALVQSYLSARELFAENYHPLPGAKPITDLDEFDLAAELKALSSAGKIPRMARNKAGYVEVTNDADEEQLQDEANRTGVSIEYVKNGEAWIMHPDGGNF